MKSSVLSLDQGTTSSRAVLFDRNCKIIETVKCELKQIYPQPGWAEQDPMDLWSTQIRAARRLIRKHGKSIGAVGIANQRETTIVWDRHNGKPIYNAIAWQCRRTAGIIDRLKSKGLAPHIQETTGLIPDAYFSGPKIKWILDNVPKAKTKARKGELIFGTVDTYLVWKLTGGRVHSTDYSNASRTMLFDIRRGRWDKQLLDALEIPVDMLPEVKSSNDYVGFTDKAVVGREIPICAVLGDQQAALFGQACFTKGSVKNTYGTGSFTLANIGEQPSLSKSGLISTIAWSLDGKITYALEGSVFIGGAIVQWLREGLGIIGKNSDTELIGRTTADSGGVFFVPALSGLGAPYWDMYARGMIIGITRDTRRNHVVRAALESICLQTADVVDVMRRTAQIRIRSLAVDGGAAANNFLMQLQADLLGLQVERPMILETTALGASFLAGLTSGVWQDMEELRQLRRIGRVFTPAMPRAARLHLRQEWKRAVERCRNWTNPRITNSD